MSGKLLIEWRHDLCAEIVKKRYINDQEILHSAHAEIVSLFFPLETSDESDDINSETSEKSCKYKQQQQIFNQHIFFPFNICSCMLLTRYFYIHKVLCKSFMFIFRFYPFYVSF